MIVKEMFEKANEENRNYFVNKEAVSESTLYKVRSEGRIVSKAAYAAIGINIEGFKGVLGIWKEKMKMLSIG